MSSTAAHKYARVIVDVLTQDYAAQFGNAGTERKFPGCAVIACANNTDTLASLDTIRPGFACVADRAQHQNRRPAVHVGAQKFRSESIQTLPECDLGDVPVITRADTAESLVTIKDTVGAWAALMADGAPDEDLRPVVHVGPEHGAAEFVNACAERRLGNLRIKTRAGQADPPALLDLGWHRAALMTGRAPGQNRCGTVDVGFEDGGPEFSKAFAECCL
jgi:hypothetical protein